MTDATKRARAIFELAQQPHPPTDVVRAAYAQVLELVCELMALDSAAVTLLNPQTQRRGATGSEFERAGARARMVAIYLTVTVVGIRQRQVAAAAHVTPAACCMALRAIEWERDDPTFDRLLDAAAQRVLGEPEATPDFDDLLNQVARRTIGGAA